MYILQMFMHLCEKSSLILLWIKKRNIKSALSMRHGGSIFKQDCEVEVGRKVSLRELVKTRVTVHHKICK